MACILEKLFPDIYIPSVFELPLDDMKQRGIKALVFDIDNTIAPYDIAHPEENIVKFFSYLRSQGFRICIFSNNNKKRVKRFNEKIHTLAVHRAGKPGIKKLKRAIERMKATPATTAMIGDQIFTDMWCGRRGGLYCVMTAPLCNRDQFVTKIKRGIERIIMDVYFKKIQNG